MRKNLLSVLVLFCLMLSIIGQAFAAPRGGNVHVNGHITKRGTYVAPHVQTAPNKTKTDNWSSKGNVNPYTGKAGTKNPYAPTK